MGDFQAVAKQFVEFYYDKFDSNRQELSGLYKPHSMLTFESTSILGVGPIIEKLTTLPFEKVKHAVSTLDAQPTSEGNGILILVTGALLVDDEQKPLNYSQVFTLLQADGSWYVYNDIFKLVFG